MAQTGLFFEDLAIGQRAEGARTIHGRDIEAFAEVSGDFNPLHLDAAYAAGTAFKTPIAHGMLTASLISALIADRLPGPGAIYVSQTLRFRRPVRAGDAVTTSVEIIALDPAKGHVTFACRCAVKGKTVVDGEAVAAAPRRADG